MQRLLKMIMRPLSNVKNKVLINLKIKLKSKDLRIRKNNMRAKKLAKKLKRLNYAPKP
jgi:hypothetical protein